MFTPLVFQIAFILNASFAQESPSYAEINKQYQETYFQFLTLEGQLTDLKAAHQSATEQVPRLEAQVEQARKALAKIQSDRTAQTGRIDNASAELKALEKALAETETLAKQELDDADDSDVLQQLAAYKAKTNEAIAAYDADIKLEKRKIARVKRSPEYQFYVKEIDIRERRLARLAQDRDSVANDIELISNELGRLRNSLSVYQSRLASAEEQLPALSEKIDQANQALNEARQSGDEFQIQIAESELHQAHANFRRVEVQRNDAERGVNETQTQVEKKEKLSVQKQNLLAEINRDTQAAKAELDQLTEDFSDYHTQNLKAFEDRLKELNSSRTQLVSKVERIDVASANVTQARKMKSDKVTEIGQLVAQLEKIENNMVAAEKALEARQQALAAGVQAVAKAKSDYNSSIAKTQQLYTSALALQQQNQAAIANTSPSLQQGDLR